MDLGKSFLRLFDFHFCAVQLTFVDIVLPGN